MSGSTLFDPNFSPNPSLTILRWLLVLFTCFVIGSTLLRIIDTLGFRGGHSDRNPNWSSSRYFFGSYRVRKGPRMLEPLDIRSERVERRSFEDGDEDKEGKECAAVAPDVKDTCIQT